MVEFLTHIQKSPKHYYFDFQNQKDLLDTELDLYNASSNGDNAMGLKRKINQLKSEVYFDIC